MPQDLKVAILQNTFLEQLRTNMAVDRVAFESLCQALIALRQEWKHHRQIDKQLMQELYVLAPVTKNVADSLKGHNLPLYIEISEMAIKLDALVLDCLAN